MQRNINFMWLLEGCPAPDHNTIARFIAAVDMNAVLVKVNKLLIEMKEIRFENAFIDGTKLEANAADTALFGRVRFRRTGLSYYLKPNCF